MSHPSPKPTSSPWELAAEAIAVKIRWFGLLVGSVLINAEAHPPRQQLLLNAVLALGAVYTTLDTWFSLRGKVFLGRSPVVISFMEALFIGLLCYWERGLDSPFRYYYFLSVICCALRHPWPVTYLTCALHSLSFLALYLALPEADRHLTPLALTLVMLGWVTWACAALAGLLRRVGDYLGQLNTALQRNQAELEARIAERTHELQEAQAHVLHQEKMAAFGLLAAGIAHEVGNPLTSVSSLVQLLRRQGDDPYTLHKLALIDGQLQRIRGTLRELVQFSRPSRRLPGLASVERLALGEILDEALHIAKYYKRGGGRIGAPTLPANLPPLYGVRDQLVQVFLNLVLNALDAVPAGPAGRVSLSVRRCLPEAGHPEGIAVSIRDNGPGIDPGDADRLFQPYFTTKEQGTGLGLFVSRKLVHEHAGRITFHTSTEGTTFSVFLPFRAVGARESVPSAEALP